jgi:NADH dehydrogenase [ubiquinone] 1 alpha subcomplex assembly factor 7
LHDSPAGSVWETSPASQAVVRTIAERIATDAGTALIIDYGFARQSTGESLQALRGHQRHDPLADPGTADITAHVDFAALARSAQDAGVHAHGPVDQGRFLLSLGMNARAERLRTAAMARNRPDQATAVATAFKRLIAPTEMGSLFKVLALSGPHQPAPPGFAEASQSETS